MRAGVSQALQALRRGDPVLDEWGCPTVHENGFVQQPLPVPQWRLHIWHPDLPHQTSWSPIHDHRFSFESWGLLGRLENVEMDAVYTPLGPYRVHAVRKGRLLPTPHACTTRVVRHEAILPGMRYVCDIGQLHESVPRGLAATLFHKTIVDPAYPVRVLGLRGEAPDNGYDRANALPLEGLRTLVWEVLSLIRKSGALGENL